MIRVMIVDDHPMWREGVARDLGSRGYDVCATASDATSAVKIALATRPDVVVMDLQLGTGSAVDAPRSAGSGVDAPRSAGSGADATRSTGSGVDATRSITSALPDTRVLVLSASAEPDDVLAAVKNGASGYLVKSASLDEFDDAVRRTAEGDAVFTPGLAGLLLGEYRRLNTTGPEAPHLTDRETEVLRLVARGLTAKQIATRLVLSHRTVENHVQNTLRKLQLHNRAELVRYALENGLTE
ncbi:LuxR C-terminal-related transcriptional regulator [Kribbella jejuensis]|uniref:LuxR family two component transcriptional regulator n=1 Tax=Kribbella jejuensis TaxID=236068 RepID=A0A542EM65_9ACTN|nr:response regulator transcription factor [Kribbella jejuensis]TQJ16433.1 LuxR family two component transcriptional regulator [Kribbella jejuensis]